jgi:hypothetical protein
VQRLELNLAPAVESGLVESAADSVLMGVSFDYMDRHLAWRRPRRHCSRNASCAEPPQEWRTASVIAKRTRICDRLRTRAQLHHALAVAVPVRPPSDLAGSTDCDMVLADWPKARQNTTATDPS